MALHANTALVAQAWLTTLFPAAMVGSTLPEPAKWAATGFVKVGPVVGGSVNIYVPERHPVVQVDCYATWPNSEKVNRAQANDLAETIRAACYLPVPAVTLRNTVKPVHLSSVYPITEPRELAEPATNFGRYTLDIHIGWIEQDTVIG